MTVITNSKELMEELESIEQQLSDPFLARFAIAAERRVKLKITEEGLVDKGRFRTSVSGRKVGPGMILISDGVTYGIYHELGTGIYGPKAKPITPKNAQALRFEAVNFVRTGGSMRRQTNVVFAKSVKGVPAKAPFRKAMDEFQEDIDRSIQATVKHLRRT